MPNLQKPATLQPSKPNSPSAIIGAGQALPGALPRLPRGQGTGGPTHSVELPAGQPAPLPLTSMVECPSFPPRLMPSLVLLLRANAGLFSGCPVLAKPTLKISVGNY